jgi:hypothetical protein
MAFRVRFSDNEQLRDYSDEDGFEFLEGGVLAIHFGDEAKWSEFHPPGRWHQVLAEPDHLPGVNTPYVDEIEEDFEDDEYEDDDDFETDEESPRMDIT